jgi:(S)-mandelate dehydrogenase
MSGGVRRGSDVLKAMALGAEAVLAGRAPLYGLCAGGAAGVARALEILRTEMLESLGLLGANTLQDLREHAPQFLVRATAVPTPGAPVEEAPTAWTPPPGEPRPTAH